MAEQFEAGNLRRLSEGDLEVAPNEPDIRGWTVCMSDGTELGEVEDLIVDSDAMKVRFIELDGEATDGTDEPIYIPIDRADLDRAENRVIVRGDRAASIRSFVAPGFGQQFGARRASETSTTSEMSTERGAEHTGEAQRLTRAEEEVRIGKRAVQAGEVRVGKHVETDHRREDVTVAREEVHVERRPVSGQQAGEIRASESEIRVPITEEEVVVEKRPVVKEELVISKEHVQETRPVDVEVRKEEFDIHDDRSKRGVDDKDLLNRRGGQ
jgi:uncharacterized protein (TIGR02271 family)